MCQSLSTRIVPLVLFRHFVFACFLGFQNLSMSYSTFSEHKFVSTINVRVNSAVLIEIHVHSSFRRSTVILARAMRHEHLLELIRLPFISSRGVVGVQVLPIPRAILHLAIACHAAVISMS
jgi:hypothetical protein